MKSRNGTLRVRLARLVLANQDQIHTPEPTESHTTLSQTPDLSRATLRTRLFVSIPSTQTIGGDGLKFGYLPTDVSTVDPRKVTTQEANVRGASTTIANGGRRASQISAQVN